MNILKSNDSTLVIGDTHIAPDQDLRRAKWLGRLINEVKPNRVLFIGDFLTFDSLSDWDKNKRAKMEARRYQKDIDSGKEFLKLMYWEMDETPKGGFILCEGNHEHRLRRYLDIDPTFEGSIDYVEDLGIESWKVIPYKEYYKYKGVHFTHVPINESGKPVGGKSACARSLELVDGNIVFGHTHKLSSSCVHRHGSKHLSQALNVGCYFEHIDDYALGSITSYWRGVVLIDHYETGSFDWQPIRLGRLKKIYGV